MYGASPLSLPPLPSGPGTPTDSSSVGWPPPAPPPSGLPLALLHQVPTEKKPIVVMTAVVTESTHEPDANVTNYNVLVL